MSFYEDLAIGNTVPTFSMDYHMKQAVGAEITDSVLTNLKKNISEPQIQSLKPLMNKRFSHSELSNSLKELHFAEKEIDTITRSAMNINLANMSKIPTVGGLKLMTEALQRAANPGYVREAGLTMGTSLTEAGKNVLKLDLKLAKTVLSAGAGAGAYAGASALAGVGALKGLESLAGVGVGAIAGGAAVAGAMNINYAQQGFTQRNRIQNVEHKYNMGSTADLVFAMHNRR